MPVIYGQDLVQVSNEIAVAETPEKTQLRKQVSDLVDDLQYEENVVHHTDPFLVSMICFNILFAILEVGFNVVFKIRSNNSKTQ